MRLRLPPETRMIDAVVAEFRHTIEPAVLNAARAAAPIMAMNNVYYRFLHLVENDEYSKLPARLRMNVIAVPGAARADFELWCLAVSAANGGGRCITAHEKVVREAGMSIEQIQAAVRIASVVHGVAATLDADAHFEGSELAAAAWAGHCTQRRNAKNTRDSLWGED